MIATGEAVIAINAVEYIADFKLKLLFSDGNDNIIDFEPFLKSSSHPDIASYLNIDKFRNYSLDHGVLHWNDYDLIFPMSVLYSGTIEH